MKNTKTIKDKLERDYSWENHYTYTKNGVTFNVEYTKRKRWYSAFKNGYHVTTRSTQVELIHNLNQLIETGKYN